MDPFYDLGATFLRLPARATRDCERGDVVGTSVDLEVWGALSLREPGGPSAVQPPYFTVAFEPATGRLLSSRVVGKTSAFEVYDDLLWDFIQSYLGGGTGGVNQTAGDAPIPPTHRPAVLTSTDVALADYAFGVLQGCGTEVHHVSPDSQVQWPAVSVAADGKLEDCARGTRAKAPPPLMRDVLEHVQASLLEAGLAASLLCDAHLGICSEGGRAGGGDGEGSPFGGDGVNVQQDYHHALGDGAAGGGVEDATVCATGDATSDVQLVLLGGCHDGKCARLVARSCLKRCSVCKVCSRQLPPPVHRRRRL